MACGPQARFLRLGPRCSQCPVAMMPGTNETTPLRCSLAIRYEVVISRTRYSGIRRKFVDGIKVDIDMLDLGRLRHTAAMVKLGNPVKSKYRSFKTLREPIHELSLLASHQPRLLCCRARRHSASCHSERSGLTGGSSRQSSCHRYRRFPQLEYLSRL